MAVGSSKWCASYRIRRLDDDSWRSWRASWRLCSEGLGSRGGVLGGVSSRLDAGEEGDGLGPFGVLGGVLGARGVALGGVLARTVAFVGGGRLVLSVVNGGAGEAALGAGDVATWRFLVKQ